MAGGSGSEIEKSGLVNTLQGHIDDLRSSLQCGICIRPLYEPFTLACGHTFCYSCLSSWFSGGRSKRTCPDCRAPVKTQPAPAYLVRTIVQMFTSRAELLDKEETTADHSQSHKEEIEKLDKDKNNTDPYQGGLFGGLFKPKPPALKPIVDVDDGVARCPMCSWELEDDHACGGCGWLYRPDSDGSDLSESDFTETDEYDSALEDEEAEEDDFGEMEQDASMFGPYGPLGYFEGVPAAVVGPSWGHMHVPPFHYSHTHHFPPPRPMGNFHVDEDDYEEDEDDDYDDMDSFIDDGEGEHGEDYESQSDHSTVVGGPRALNQPSSRAAFSYPPYVPSDSEDEESEITQDDSFAPAASAHQPRSSSPYSSFPMCTSEEEEEEEGDEAASDEDDSDNPHTGGRRPQFFQPTSISPATNDESEPESSSSPPRPMRTTRLTHDNGSSARNAITIDDSEEDQPVGPMRRTAQRRQARFSPY